MEEEREEEEEVGLMQGKFKDGCSKEARPVASPTNFFTPI